MPAHREFTVRLRFAVLGAVSGCVAFIALMPFQQPEARAATPDPSDHTGAARRAPLTASGISTGGSNHERDIAAAEAVMDEHPDAVSLPVDAILELLGADLTPYTDLLVSSFASEVLHLTPEEKLAVERLRLETYRKLQEIDARTASVSIPSENEMTIEIDASTPERDKVFREAGRKARHALGTLRGNLLAKAQENSLLLGSPLLSRKMSIHRSPDDAGIIEWHFRGESKDGELEISTRSAAVTLNISDFGLLDPLVDLDHWTVRDGIKME